MNKEHLALDIQNFTYHYKSDWTGRKFLAVNDVSVSVREGESFGFLGQSGSGKTTTIKAILGLTHPTAGSIRIFGKDNRDPEARKCIGYLPEQPYFYDHLTVRELVTMYAHLAGVAKADVSQAVTRSLNRVKIAHKEHSRMRELSKGLTQRVAMAQAIVAEPKLLILDEPFSGLDPLGRKEFKDLLFEIKEGGAAIFISSHILEDIEFLCDRASIMVNGEIRLILDLDDLASHVERHYDLTIEKPIPDSFQLNHLRDLSDEQGSSVVIRFNSREDAERTLRDALEKNATISQYKAAHGNLEELFVKLVRGGGKP